VGVQQLVEPHFLWVCCRLGSQVGGVFLPPSLGSCL
jgi:hypothetical protein